MSTVPPAPGYFSDNPYQVPGSPPGYNPPRRGMVQQIRIVAILNAIQGVLELVMSLVYLLMGGFFGLFMRAELARNDPNGEVFAYIMAGIMLAFGAVLLISSLLRLYAALRNYTLQSRVTAIVSLCLGLLSVFTGYCAPTAIGIAVYGLIVFFNKEVVEAFEMRSKGTSADDVLSSFQARPM